MKILLIEPAIYKKNEIGREYLYKCKLRDIHDLSPTLPYLAALVPKDFKVDLAYEVSEDIEGKYMLEDYDIVGITCQTSHLKRTLELARKLRMLNTHVVVGGPATIEDNRCLVPVLKRFCSTVIIGEADRLWPEFLEDFKAGNPRQVYQSGSIIALKGLPIPNYELVNLEYYAKPHVFPVMTSRGCPRKCSFCSEFLYGTWRLRPINEIVKEIRYLSQTYNVSKIAFRDDNLLISRKRAFDLLENIAPLNIEWSCQTDLSIALQPDLVKLAIDAGLKSVSFGLESIEVKNRNSINKNIVGLPKVKDLLIYLNQNNIETQINTIFGFDDDTIDVFDRTVDFLIESHVSLFFASILYPIPGTPLYMRLLRENRILNEHPPGIEDALLVNFAHQKMTKKQLVNGFLHAKKRFLMERKSSAFWLGEHQNIWGTD